MFTYWKFPQWGIQKGLYKGGFYSEGLFTYWKFPKWGIQKGLYKGGFYSEGLHIGGFQSEVYKRVYAKEIFIVKVYILEVWLNIS